MGSLQADLDEQPVHKVHLEDFYIGKYQVTQEQWFELFKGLPEKIYHRAAKLPITEVSWYEAVNYCNALSLSKGVEPYYGINKFDVQSNGNAGGYRLPSEAEWEFAARGGLKSKGFLYSGSNSIDEVAWYVSNSHRQIHSVGLKKPNELGIYDMSGNVYEYCWDEYRSYSDVNYQGVKKTNTSNNPPDFSNIQEKSFKLPARVIRGGNCYGLPYRQRNTSRYKYQFIGYKHDFIGFRVAQSI